VIDEQKFDHHGWEKHMFDRLAWRRECYERYLLGPDDEEPDDQADTDDYEVPASRPRP
jgi:hypothetical protein